MKCCNNIFDRSCANYKIHIKAYKKICAIILKENFILVDREAPAEVVLKHEENFSNC